MLNRAIALPMWSQAMLVAVIGASIAARSGASRPSWLSTASVGIAIAGKMYQHAAIVLPDAPRPR